MIKKSLQWLRFVILSNLGRQKGKITVWIFFFFLFIILATLAGFVYFSSRSQPKEPDIGVSFYDEGAAVIGRVYDYLFTFRSPFPDDILSPEVVIIWPQDFRLTSSNPVCTERLANGCLWELGKFSQKRFMTILLKGKFLGSEHLERQFKGRVNFKLAGISSDFQKDFIFSTKLKPCLFLETDLPDSLPFGEKTVGRVKVNNLADKEISNIRVIVRSDNFVFVPSNSGDSPEIDKNGKKMLNLDISKLESLGEKNLEFEGYVSPPFSENDTSLKSVSLEFIAGLSEKEDFFPQIRLVRNLKVD